MHYIQSIFHFFADNFPSIQLMSWLFPISIIWSFAALLIAGFCKKNLNWKTGYTRKLFHFFIFISALFYQRYFALPGVFILGWSVTIALVFACIKGAGNILYEALAREKDAPFRTKYIVYSYLATFLGGVISNLLFGKFAILGYAITGIGDAIAEPVGTRFGKHQYRVFSFDKAKVSYRSIEGSLAVFITSYSIYFIAFYITQTIFPATYFIVFIMAFICTITEALSPSGFDNMLLQITASFLFSLFVEYNH